MNRSHSHHSKHQRHHARHNVQSRTRMNGNLTAFLLMAFNICACSGFMPTFFSENTFLRIGRFSRGPNEDKSHASVWSTPSTPESETHRSKLRASDSRFAVHAVAIRQSLTNKPVPARMPGTMPALKVQKVVLKNPYRSLTFSKFRKRIFEP